MFLMHTPKLPPLILSDVLLTKTDCMVICVNSKDLAKAVLHSSYKVVADK